MRSLREGATGLARSARTPLAPVDHLQKGRFSNTRSAEAPDLVDKIKPLHPTFIRSHALPRTVPGV
jgi:hypothetical protein